MRIALIVPALRAKGPVIVARDLASGLINQGHHVEVFYLDNVHALEFPCTTTRLTWRTVCRLAKFDVIHSHSLRPDAVAWLGKYVMRRPAFVSTIHNYVEIDLSQERGRLVSSIASKIWRALWNRLDRCAVLTVDAQNYYSNLRVPTTVIYNSRPPAQPEPLAPEDRNLLEQLRVSYRIVGAAAAVIGRKGFRHVIEALPQLEGYVFVLVGEGPELTSLRSLASDLGVSHRFIALGYRDNARDFMRHFDLFIMPSTSEGMPLAMLEAAFSRTPIACSDLPLFRELFPAEYVGFFRVADPRSLAETVRSIETKYSELAARAYTHASRNYSYDSMVQSYISFYKKAVKENE